MILVRNCMCFRSFCLILALVFSISTLSAPSAKADGLLDFLFPSGSKGPNPAKTLRAPFANDDAVIEDMDASKNAENLTDLHLRHRPSIVITRWVQQNIPNMLSYKAVDYEQKYKKKILNFSRAGSEEYLAFLQNKDFITTLKTGRYDISGFIKDYPIIVNEGPIDGRFRWLYQINVMVTYLDSDANYKASKDLDSITQEFVITFQLGRSKDVVNEHNLIIETWHVKPNKAG